MSQRTRTKPRQWRWTGWLIPRGKQFTSSTTGTPCLYDGDEESIEDINQEIDGKPVRVSVLMTELVGKGKKR